MSDTDLSRANLQFADLRNADLQNAILRFANMSDVDLHSANLRNVTLERTILHGANLSRVKGLPLQSEWIEANLERVENGWIAYKRIGNTLHGWIWGKVTNGMILEENLNTDRTSTWTYGVNVGTKEYCEERYIDSDLWKVLIPFGSGICVPYQTCGGFRVEKCILIERVNV